MPTKLPAGFTPDPQQKLPPGFVPDAAPDPLMQQTQSVARAAGVGGPAPQPLDPQMRAQGKQYESSLGPQARIEQLGTPEEKERFSKGMDMTVPETLMGAGALGPIGGITRQGVAGYASSLARPLLKSVAGAEIGNYGGRAIGGLFGKGGSETGGKVGGALGAIAGPFVGGETFAKLPFGLGRFVATDEETAAARTAMKLAQRESDIAAGLRKPLGQIAVDPNTLTPIEEDIPGTVARTKGRMVLTPEEARTRERMAPMWQKRASERGMIFAGGGVPEEGRSVPMRPTPTTTHEYGGPRSTTPLGSIGSPQINFTQDKLGVNWAERNGVQVRIPNSVPEAEMQDYAARKLSEQEAMQKALPGRTQ